MSYIHRRWSAAISCALLLALAACGGGGGGGGGIGSGSGSGGDAGLGSGAGSGGSSAPLPGGSVAQPAPAASSAEPVSPPASGASDPVSDAGSGCVGEDMPSFRSSALGMLNVVRSALSLAPFTRLDAFDLTAQAHARYVVSNHSGSIEETAGLPCFTGATLARRLAAAGIASDDLPGERGRTEALLAYQAPPNGEVQPWDVVYYMLHNVYGRMAVLDPRTRQVGVGVTAVPGSTQRALVLDTALLPDTEATDPATYAVWPRDGATGLPTQMRASNMKPLDAGVTEGYPVSLHAAAPVQISRFVMTKTSDGSPVAATLVTRGTDRNSFLSSREAALVPDAPLAAGTTYRVELEALVGTMPLRLVWSFTTAPSWVS